jgi:hypothetical protein
MRWTNISNGHKYLLDGVVTGVTREAYGQGFESPCSCEARVFGTKNRMTCDLHWCGASTKSVIKSVVVEVEEGRRLG